MKTILAFFGGKLAAGIVLAILAVAVAGWGMAYTRGVDLDLTKAKLETCASERTTALGAATSAVDSAKVFKGLHEQCVAEGTRVRGANEQAVRDAVAKAKAEAKSEADFNARLAKQTPDCEAIKRMKVCASLRDY